MVNYKETCIKRHHLWKHLKAYLVHPICTPCACFCSFKMQVQRFASFSSSVKKPQGKRRDCSFKCIWGGGWFAAPLDYLVILYQTSLRCCGGGHKQTVYVIQRCTFLPRTIGLASVLLTQHINMPNDENDQCVTSLCNSLVPALKTKSHSSVYTCRELCTVVEICNSQLYHIIAEIFVHVSYPDQYLRDYVTSETADRSIS